ncbi:MarR family transcriptional regulator [Caldibacillus thermolactis]|jgi:MarR family transcriptional regulator, 2-MHQ and catechol-resistance regulon repressor|uniref:MarR family transcriptional regulator n=1 Tax=Pallidibacillus thermolactis TaxID=251051 RepID=A0ABT2WI50_9BACI|nr:MarR family transcriptional regulator [Pallidibacillus thermolactis]MCU9595369.1 MarR family transcriptional regulator [Pallidibacillus thermolactis]MCU9602524.1 MarR family transcriptional regulator [Pallidibacillus thermolactis subsp. kokeshiiformis]MED1674701.1 MarR family transcriptional regulator [Pallidibacillus thermolactis subsp. kokeshiiformis]
MTEEATKLKDEELSLKLFIILTRALEAIEKNIVKNIKSYGLNLTEFGVLELLYHKGDQPIQKIGQKILLASSSITYVVDKLEEKNYLIRKACPTDRRVTYASITEEGKTLMDDIFPKHRVAMSKIMAGLNIEEKEIVIDKVKKLGLYAQELE